MANDGDQWTFYQDDKGEWRWRRTARLAPEWGGTTCVMDLGAATLPWRNLWLKPSSSLTPTVNGTMTIQATSNTQLTFKLKGSDGTVRSGNLTLS